MAAISGHITALSCYTSTGTHSARLLARDCAADFGEVSTSPGRCGK
jgi:hypothetical protein